MIYVESYSNLLPLYTSKIYFTNKIVNHILLLLVIVNGCLVYKFFS